MSSNLKNFRILIVDDEPLIRQSLCEILRIDGYKVQMAASAEEAQEIIAQQSIDVVVTDLKLPKLSGVELLKWSKEKYPAVEFILITGYGCVETAVEAMKEGAFEYITKPINDEEIKILIRNIVDKKNILSENQALKEELKKERPASFAGMIGSSERIRKIYHTVQCVADSNATILITGESGTGKGMVAKAIHQSDKTRKDKRFIEVSCGALSETLLESELFGHVKGAFTGAIKDKEGRFEYADGGTIFLDEIDTFSPELQVKLLRVLQDGVFERVGDNKTLKAHARVIVATNKDLLELIEDSEFREDLYYRINVINIKMPPLRERKEDLEGLVTFFVAECARKNNKKIEGVSPKVMELFKDYAWPGNIRELQNAIEGAVILSRGPIIEVEDLADSAKFKKGPGGSGKKADLESMYLRKVVEEPEKEHILSVLEECNWNRNRAAAALGINRTTLYNKMKKYNIKIQSK